MSGQRRGLAVDTHVEAVSSTGGSLLLAVKEKSHAKVVSADLNTFTVRPLITTSIGVSALTLSHGETVLGYKDGSVEIVKRDNSRFELSLSESGSSEIVALIEGPPKAFVAAFANGEVGLCSQDTGEMFVMRRVHGRPVHLLLKNQVLYAASDLGQQIKIDLSVFYKSRCELLREVWKRVPTVWRNGRPVTEKPPPEHDCLKTN